MLSIYKHEAQGCSLSGFLLGWESGRTVVVIRRLWSLSSPAKKECLTSMGLLAWRWAFCPRIWCSLKETCSKMMSFEFKSITTKWCNCYHLATECFASSNNLAMKNKWVITHALGMYCKSGKFRYMKFLLEKFSCWNIFVGRRPYENIISTRKFYNIEVGKNVRRE